MKTKTYDCIETKHIGVQQVLFGIRGLILSRIIHTRS